MIAGNGVVTARGLTPDREAEAARVRRQYDAGATQVAVSLVGPPDDAKLDACRALTEEEN